ncbi:uncharacterized protein N7484_004280 [Penicillium longicatenatum]|uniref:uncharacterized protein n=1 Tax=Penicillium longicatenatum TaxID=1561947 RepID=UPI00254690E8|nr:uncharacterized protein N7484_004280 [Penicillium longicatenatum]KAJ5650557.1 hypothetical protein N7484_004280 [Penicillium longicatenatum]
MGCSGDREKGEAQLEEKWDYVNLDDFKSDSCWTPFSYIFLWIMLIVSVSVYGVDIFTAVNLLAFSRWSGRVEPAIPFKISRWIFAVCIIVSLTLLVYRWIFAIRAMRSGSITRSYLDPLAVRIQSFRVIERKGRGWKKFLVFAELTKSKKGAEYVALYTYFAFQFWMNTIFADGPRQVINAITLYSVMKMDLLPGGENTTSDGNASGIIQFFNNVKVLAEENNLQAVVLFGMLFTLVIWVLSVLKLASAVILYLIFLFHHIPAEDGSLKAYCRRKISTRLKRIVRRKVDKALAKGLQLQDRVPTRPGLATADSKPTLPSIDMDKTPVVTTLSRSTTETTLPPYTRSNSTRTERMPTLPNLELDSKPPLSRTTTKSSAISADSAPLTANAAPMGYSPLDRHASPLPPVPPVPHNVPSRMGSAHAHPTPGPQYTNETESSYPPSQYRNLTDSREQPTRTYTPAADPYATFAPRLDTTHDYYDRYGPSGDVYEEDEFDNYQTSMHHSDNNAQHGYHSQEGYQARSYTPASAGGNPRSQDPYQARSYTPASTGGTYRPEDPYQARSYTPAGTATAQSQDAYQSYSPTNGAAAEFSQDGYQNRSYTPASTTTPHPQNEYRSYTPATTGTTIYHQDGYQARSFTPANAATTPYPQVTAPPLRSMTPASRATPAPQQADQSMRPPPRSFTPMSPEGSASQSTGYTALNPSGSSSTPQPRMPRVPPPAGYQPFTRANTASPSTMNRNGPPAGYSFNRAHTDQF